MKAYIIIAGTGEYSDRLEKPLRVFLDKERAQAAMLNLEKIMAAHYPLQRHDTETWDEYGKRRRRVRDLIRAEYEAEGYAVWDGECDWTLEEAPLDNLKAAI